MPTIEQSMAVNAAQLGPSVARPAEAPRAGVEQGRSGFAVKSLPAQAVPVDVRGRQFNGAAGLPQRRFFPLKGV